MTSEQDHKDTHGVEMSAPGKSGPSRRQKLGIAVACVAVLSAVGGGVAVYALINNRPPTEKTPADPGKTPKTPEEKAAKTTTPTNSTDEYEAAMERYRDMSVDEFEALPRDERLLYSQFLIDQTVERGNYESTYGKGHTGEKYGVTPAVISRDNSGQEVFGSNLYALQISYLQFVESEDKPYDLSDGQKVLSAVYYDVGNANVTNSYTNAVNTEQTLDTPVGIDLTGTVINTSDLLEGNSMNGDKVEYRILTYYDNKSKTRYAKYIYHEFTSYDGARKAVWMIDQIEDSLDSIR